MKKTHFFLIILAFFSLNFGTNAQINLEHTFQRSVSFNGSIYTEPSLYPADCYIDAYVDNNSYVVKIYNADYSVKSNDTYNFTPPSGYKLGIVSMSRKMFNTDDNYEFMVTYVKIDYPYSDNTLYKVILYNQNGSVIKDFGTANYLYVYPYLHIANNHFRLLIQRKYYDETTQIEIYSIPGTPPVAPTITTTSLPIGTVGMNYNATLTATGDAPITWSLDNGSLPNGLNLSSAGLISGIPTETETSNFTVKAANSAGSDKKGFSIFIDEETGISMLQMAEVKIFPNPANDKLIIECENVKKNKIILYDMTGNEILSQNIHGKTEINISNLQKGSYIVSVMSENETIGNFKIVKQ